MAEICRLILFMHKSANLERENSTDISRLQKKPDDSPDHPKQKGH